ncbi:MAG: histidine--tRNA ligase [Chlorobi bacterium]|nr:histidine--tRNA ligase [Chlorobiota bacterium]
MASRYQSLKGFRDTLPEESLRWQWLEGIIRDQMRRYGYGELRLPLVESTELFSRGVGEGTDVVSKEMYSFLDKSDPPESLTLRPELTAGAVRAWIEHEIGKNQGLTKWYYVGPAFRYEQPQSGRYRQFTTFGIELIGSPLPEADAEVILAGVGLIESLGIRNYRLRLNSLGMPEERAAYRVALLEFLNARRSQLSQESIRRMESNPLRVLDSKKEEDVAATADAPKILDFLADESRAHFNRVRGLLDDAGVQYVVDHKLVRGLDYYTRTAFEFQGLDLGAQDALGGGGRYDGLIEQLGGPATPAIGFGFGIDRLLLAAEAAGAIPNQSAALDVFVVGLGDSARAWAVQTTRLIRQAGLAADCDLLGRSMKAQMREANRRNARHVVIAGDNELAAGKAQLKDMQGHAQQEVELGDLLNVIQSREEGG